MKAKLFKYLTIAGALSIVGLGSASATTVIIERGGPGPSCRYYDGYMVCVEGRRSVTYRPISAVKICKGNPAHGMMCHYRYCYRPAMGPKVCQDYYPNRLY